MLWVLLAAFPLLAAPPLMPWPAQIYPGRGSMEIDAGFRVTFHGYRSPLLDRAATRFVKNLGSKTGLSFSGGGRAGLRIVCAGEDPDFLTERADESYSLRITPQGAEMAANGPAGVLRGLATFLQSVENGRAAELRILDRPRFAWRGLMLDVSRHFMTLETLRRQLDAMEAVKLNVLHLHLTDAQGFRVESKLYPKLQGAGSEGQFYTQAEVRELIEAARDRGIRVVPEFDVPGHCKSWLVGYPELASKPGPYRMGPDADVANAALDPTKEDVYRFLDRLFGEMGRLFPDRYFHIGGDEVSGQHWRQSTAIQRFAAAKGLKDQHALQAYFSKRVHAILLRHGKRMMGWDEMLDEGLPADAVVEAWRSSKMQARSARLGHATVVSTGYYLDWAMPSSFHYSIDPLDTAAIGLTAEQQRRLKGTFLEPVLTADFFAGAAAAFRPEDETRVLGCEAALWSEMVTDEMLDGRVWPRAVAMAERFWSPRNVRDEESMYARLAAVDRDLEVLGMRHRTNSRAMLDRISPHAAALAGAVEPLRYYARFRMRNKRPASPMADAVAPESLDAREFQRRVSRLLLGDKTVEPELRAKLTAWREAAEKAPELAIAGEVKSVAEVGLEALAMRRSGQTAVLEKQKKDAAASADFVSAFLDPQPASQLLVVIAPAVEQLVNGVRQ